MMTRIFPARFELYCFEENFRSILTLYQPERPLRQEIGTLRFCLGTLTVLLGLQHDDPCYAERYSGALRTVTCDLTRVATESRRK